VSVYQETLPNKRTRWRIDILWTSADGVEQRVRKVSPVNTKKGAEKYEREIRNALSDDTFGRKKRSHAPTLSAFRERYFDDHVATLKPSMRSAQETIWRMSLLPVLANMPIDKIDEEAIAKVAGSLRKRKASPKTVNNALSALRTALTKAKEWKLISAVPEFAWMKVPQQKFAFLTFAEADELVAVDVHMVTIALRTGMRVGELLALRWSDVSLSRGLITVERSVFWEKNESHEGGTKSGKVRSIPITSEVRAALEKLEPHPKLRQGYVFTDATGEQLTRNEAKWRIWPALKKAGLERCGWHVCRHTFASHLAMKGVPLPAIQQLMGHATIAMTMKYAHLAPDHLRSAMDALEPKNKDEPPILPDLE
jgi:integrase